MAYRLAREPFKQAIVCNKENAIKKENNSGEIVEKKQADWKT